MCIRLSLLLQAPNVKNVVLFPRRLSLKTAGLSWGGRVLLLNLLSLQLAPSPGMLQCGGVGTFSGHLSSQREQLHPSEQQSVVAHAELGCSFIDDQLGRKNKKTLNED